MPSASTKAPAQTKVIKWPQILTEPPQRQCLDE
jgi:hypothetical protein